MFPLLLTLEPVITAPCFAAPL